jgi:hypothetical protein
LLFNLKQSFEAAGTDEVWLLRIAVDGLKEVDGLKAGAARRVRQEYEQLV